MNTTDILILALILAVIWYWLDSIQAKHLASDAGRRECDRANVEFLDDTVVLKQVRLHRNAHGRVQIKRIYEFEFTADQQSRFNGRVVMLGNRSHHVSLEPYRLG